MKDKKRNPDYDICPLLSGICTLERMRQRTYLIGEIDSKNKR